MLARRAASLLLPKRLYSAGEPPVSLLHAQVQDAEQLFARHRLDRVSDTSRIDELEAAGAIPAVMAGQLRERIKRSHEAQRTSKARLACVCREWKVLATRDHLYWVPAHACRRLQHLPDRDGARQALGGAPARDEKVLLHALAGKGTRPLSTLAINLCACRSSFGETARRRSSTTTSTISRPPCACAGK